MGSADVVAELRNGDVRRAFVAPERGATVGDDVICVTAGAWVPPFGCWAGSDYLRSLRAKSSACSSRRGFIIKRCFFGRRLTTRGSTRSGR
jgi:hypothetical protein